MPPKFSFYCSSYVSTWRRKKQPSSMCKPITQHWNQQTIYQTLHPTCAIASQKSSMCINIIWLQLCVAPHNHLHTLIFRYYIFKKREIYVHHGWFQPNIAGNTLEESKLQGLYWTHLLCRQRIKAPPILVLWPCFMLLPILLHGINEAWSQYQKLLNMREQRTWINDIVRPPNSAKKAHY